MMPYVIIIIGAALSYLVSRYVRDLYHGEPTEKALLAYLIFEFVLVSVILISGGVDPLSQALMLAAWLPTILIFYSFVSVYIKQKTTGATSLSNGNRTTKGHRLEKMKALLWAEDTKGAMEVCLNEFDRYPDDFEILLDAAELFAGRGHYREAAALYEKAVNRFNNDEAVWPNAAYQAAVIYMDCLDDKVNARKMFRQLAQAFPDQEIGIRARERLVAELSTTSIRNADPFYHEKRPHHQAKTDDNKPKTIIRTLEDEMPGLFVDEEPPS